jgi:hypothetical protein
MLPRSKPLVITFGIVAVAHPIVASWVPRGNVEKPDTPTIASVAMNSTTASQLGPMVTVFHATTDERYEAGILNDRLGPMFVKTWPLA